MQADQTGSLARSDALPRPRLLSPPNQPVISARPTPMQEVTS